MQFEDDETIDTRRALAYDDLAVEAADAGDDEGVRGALHLFVDRASAADGARLALRMATSKSQSAGRVLLHLSELVDEDGTIAPEVSRAVLGR